MITLSEKGTIALNEEQKKDWEFANQLSRETRADSSSPYAGKYVGVLRQRVVAVADTLEQLDEQLDALGDEAESAVWIEASVDYDKTYYIWSFKWRE